MGLFVIAALVSVTGAAIAAAATLPFKGEMGGDVVGTPIGQTWLYAVTLSGPGRVTELGKVTVRASHITDAATGEITEGTVTFVTKNGDTLTGTYTGQEFPTDSPDMTVVEGTVRFTGGTGRFRGATGTAPLNATVTIKEITEEGVFIETFTASFDAKLALP